MVTEHATATQYGTTFAASAYVPTTDGTAAGATSDFSITDFVLTKNGGSSDGGGYRNRVGHPHCARAIVVKATPI